MEQNQVSQPLKKRLVETQQINPIRPQQQASPQNVQILKIVHYEPPMMLNAWTQTFGDDFPQINNNEAALLSKIQKLEEELKLKLEIITKMNDRASTPVHQHSQSNSPSPIEYRILNKMEGQNEVIEIELTEDHSTKTPETFIEEQKENSFIKHMHAQTVKTPILKSSNIIEGPLVAIGPNNTKVPAAEFEKISWASASIATRKLLGFIFDRETLATHSMTGKASPAFKNLDKPVKRKLDSQAIEDIIFVVTRKCGVSAKEVRSAITTKCADENKMLKLKALKNMDPRRSRSILTDSRHHDNNI